MRMVRGFAPNRYRGWQIAGFGIALLIFIALWLLRGRAEDPLLALLYWIGALSCAGAVAWLIGQWLKMAHQAKQYQGQAAEQGAAWQEADRRMALLLRLNRGLVDVQDEKTIMDRFLETAAELTGAMASSFVPMDDWGQPLSAFAYGKLPGPVMKAWAEHLAAKSVREQCKTCQANQALPTDHCPLLEGPFNETFSLFCLPMRRSGRLLGKLNLYLPLGRVLNEDLLAMLMASMNQMALMVQAVRLQNQELATLRQLQMLRPPRTDLPALLTGLLEDLRHMLGVDFILLKVQDWGFQQPELQLQSGRAEWLHPDLLESLWRKTLSRRRPANNEDGCELYEGHQLAAVPLTVPDKRITGFIIAASEKPREFDQHRWAILRHTANQIALLIENERLSLSLEFHAVIQERLRLAREIHDGLAQTLAYLKMQTAQMQNALAKGDAARLGELLRQNYQALTSAYLDTRQAIDNLRLTPQQGMDDWLERAIAEFEGISGLKVHRSFHFPDWELLPEVQSQLIRIVQEALNNIRKHAHASAVWVSLKEWDDDLILEIRDDGRGFLPEDVPYPSQFGLRGMRERAEFIGADFQIISQPRHGTTVRLRLPRYQEAPA